MMFKSFLRGSLYLMVLLVLIISPGYSSDYSGYRQFRNEEYNAIFSYPGNWKITRIHRNDINNGKPVLSAYILSASDQSEEFMFFAVARRDNGMSAESIILRIQKDMKMGSFNLRKNRGGAITGDRMRLSCCDEGAYEIYTDERTGQILLKEVYVKDDLAYILVISTPKREKETINNIQNTFSLIKKDGFNNSEITDNNSSESENLETNNNINGRDQFRILHEEKIGPLSIDMSLSDVWRILGKPDKKGKITKWGCDGYYHTWWSWISKGVTINLSSKTKNSKDFSVNSIEIKSPSKYLTKRGIGIGSSFHDVYNAYPPNTWDRCRGGDISPDTQFVIVGSMYGGLNFEFKNRKVIRIYLGASAE